MEEHWFDDLNKALVRDVPRRSMLGAAAALILGLALGPSPDLMARPRGKPVNRDGGKGHGKGKGKGKRKHKDTGKRKPTGKPKPPPNAPPTPAQSCSGGACAAEAAWAGDQNEIDYCEFICQQCDGGDPRQFCIRSGTKPDGTPTKKAVCCAAGEECCSGLCCGSSTSPSVRCCDGQCVDTDLHRDHCNGCNQPCPSGAACVDGSCQCPEGQIVCNGACVAGSECPDDSCSQTCVGPGLECCDGVCVNTRTPYQEQHCGGCNQPCTDPSKQCCDGACVDVVYNNAHCGSTCLPCPAGQECCGGACIDPQVYECCHDPSNVQSRCPIATMYCCTYTNGQRGCCFR